MLRRDDLIGHLRALDDALSSVPPPAGHAARLRARLQAEIAPRRKAALSLALAFAVLAAAFGLWRSWSAPAPEAIVPPVPAPTASDDVVAEPRPEPSTAPTSSPRWLPSRPIPALPLLPPRSDISPPPAPVLAPAPAPRTTRPDGRRDHLASTPPRTAPSALDASITSEPRPPQRHNRNGLNTNPSEVAWSDASDPSSALPGSPRPPGLPAMGSPAGTPRSSHSRRSERWRPSSSDPDPSGADTADTADTADQDDDTGTCTVVIAGGDGPCHEMGKLSYLGSVACAATGSTLYSIHPLFDCPGGMSTQAQAVCCGSAPPEEDPVTLAPKCDFFFVGGGSCASEASLEAEAASLCASMGMTMSAVDPFPDCPDGESTGARVTCCVPPPGDSPPDPSPAPLVGSVGDGECVPESALIDQALDLCAAEGMVLVECTGIHDCGPGAFLYAKYMCVP